MLRKFIASQYDAPRYVSDVWNSRLLVWGTPICTPSWSVMKAPVSCDCLIILFLSNWVSCGGKTEPEVHELMRWITLRCYSLRMFQSYLHTAVHKSRRVTVANMAARGSSVSTIFVCFVHLKRYPLHFPSWNSKTEVLDIFDIHF